MTDTDRQDDAGEVSDAAADPASDGTRGLVTRRVSLPVRRPSRCRWARSRRGTRPGIGWCDGGALVALGR